MLKIGCHLSSSKGYLAMGKEAVKIGANTFQFFTRNPRGGKAKDLDLEDVAAYRAFAQEQGLFPILAHAPYTLNACAADESLRTFARETMADDLARLEHIPGSMYNFHPGSHVKQGADEGIRLICEGLNEVLEPGQRTCVLLETMAGKGTEVGRSFEELARIIDGVAHDELLGVCLDTCHVADAGYDVVGDLPGVLDEFDRVVGLERLRALHLNDSKNPLGSHKDRHERIGRGTLGLETFAAVVTDPRLSRLPMVLETPQDGLEGWAAEIALLRGMASGEGVA